MTPNILRTAHAEFRVTDLERAKTFYVDALGFSILHQDSERLYLGNIEERDPYSLVLRKSAQPGLGHLAFKVERESDLDGLAWIAGEDGLAHKWLDKGAKYKMGRTLVMQDPHGIPLHFYYEAERRDWSLQKYHEHRGAKIQRIDHFNCQVHDVRKAYEWYTKRLGFHCSEYTAANDTPKVPGEYSASNPSFSWRCVETDDLWATWLHRKPNVHDIAMMNGVGPRLHHVGFWAYDRLSILDACDVLASMGMVDHIERGPGRHGLSNAFFLYLRDHDNNRIEIYTGDYLLTDWDVPPVRWSINDKRRATFWGHLPPKSWFDEASLVEDIITGDLMPTSDPKFLGRPTFVV